MSDPQSEYQTIYFLWPENGRFGHSWIKATDLADPESSMDTMVVLTEVRKEILEWVARRRQLMTDPEPAVPDPTAEDGGDGFDAYVHLHDMWQDRLTEHRKWAASHTIIIDALNYGAVPDSVSEKYGMAVADFARLLSMVKGMIDGTDARAVPEAGGGDPGGTGGATAAIRHGRVDPLLG